MTIKQQSEQHQREAVVAEARKWLGAKYHHLANVEYQATDCGQILLAVFSKVGLIEAQPTGPYPHDFHLHRADETYLSHVTKYAARIRQGKQQPGDLVAVQNGRSFSHAGIISEWPRIIHASAPAGMVLEEDITNSPVALWKHGEHRPMRFYSYWAKAK